MAQTIESDVLQTAQEALNSSPIQELRTLQVEKINDTLLISGVVNSYYHKQLAQEVVFNVCGSYKVVNSTDVGTFEDGNRETGDSDAADSEV